MGPVFDESYASRAFDTTCSPTQRLRVKLAVLRRLVLPVWRIAFPGPIHDRPACRNLTFWRREATGHISMSPFEET